MLHFQFSPLSMLHWGCSLLTISHWCHTPDPQRDEIQGNKVEWESFGKYIADAMVDVVAGIDVYNASNEEVKPWMESVTKLSDDAQQCIQIEIDRLHGKMERQSGTRNPLPRTKNPSRIDDSREDFSAASTFFKLRTSLTVGAIANNQNRLIRGVVNSSVLNGPRTGRIEYIMARCRNTGDSENCVSLQSAVAGVDKTSIALSIAECERNRFQSGDFSEESSSLAGPVREAIPWLDLSVSRYYRLPMVVIIDVLGECDTEAFPHVADILRKKVPRLPPNIKLLCHFETVRPR
ncbi:uncharacterized protein EI90DRAFT_200795 [Cantharellus anzutake]|uniref:uncharacterized protein n=1 Tax=Cantharellus anzutake TaxID=1750568 RepID=UPI00190882B9|nr:uncharacterized protein EI90DRAFT_200795 [Cantharellus anzutake]KAF8336605.1 hypothetical protein EI90DRAFT_200795 [Cantharellus anzutake]